MQMLMMPSNKLFELIEHQLHRIEGTYFYLFMFHVEKFVFRIEKRKR